MSASSETLVLDVHSICDCFDRLIATKAESRPLSTYRLQFHKGFRFVDAQRLIPYLHSLGISHVYASPILEARAGSTHGYDIIHHNRLNPEIGTEEEFLTFTRELAAHGMGLVLDIVPNHMGVGTATPWWRDVLENGRSSAYADFFDIDWEPLKPELKNKLLLPVLGAQYGTVLEDGQLQLELKDGNIALRYFDHCFPIDPQTLPLIFDATADSRQAPLNSSPDLHELDELLEELRSLPLHTTSDLDQARERRERWKTIKPRWTGLLQRSSRVQQSVPNALRQINGKPGEPHSLDSLRV